MFNAGDIIDERYQVEAKAGQGGMSYVYRAADLKLGREVAVKVLKEEFSADEEFVEKFKNEARAAARLSHANIVAAYDTVDRGDLHFIVMELVEGITLKNYISRKGMLSNKETIGIAIQAAEGIAEAHRKGIIHRDIKPQNIIISRDGKVKVADFGIAKAAAINQENQAVIGSAHYIAPEQAKTGEADARSDLYSLGITMYEMITGRLPYEGENTVDIVMAHIQNAMVPPSVYNHEIYPALGDIITKAARKDPEGRYQSAEELIEDLKHAAVEPEGHFVKLYDTVGSGSLTASQTETADTKSPAEPESPDSSGVRETEGTAAAAAPEAGAADGSLSAETRTDGDEEPEESGFSLLHIFENRLVLAGITLAVIAVIALAGVIAGKTLAARQNAAAAVTAAEEDPGKDASEAAETAAAADESESEEEMDYTLSIQGEQPLPDLSGLGVDEARAKLAGMQLSMDSSNTAYSDEYPEGTVINQSPLAGEIAAEDTTVFVTVSLGPESNHVLSSLKNLTVEDAAASLQRVGIGVSLEPRLEFSEDVAENYVIGYEELPAEEDQETMAVGETSAGMTETRRIIRLIVSRGRSGDYIVMPDLSGLPQQTAESLIEASGLIVGARTALNNTDHAPGTVLLQSAPAGDYVRKGTPVIIQVSVSPDTGIQDGTVLPPAAAEGSASGTDVSAYLSGDFYYGNIDTVCSVGTGKTGPGGGSEVMVAVRLAQRVEDSMEYTVIDEPRPVSLGSRIPVTYHNIQGAYGIDSGEVQVYNVSTDEIYGSYQIEFYPGD